MQKLDPKAIWAFFVQYFLIILFTIFILSSAIASFLDTLLKTIFGIQVYGSWVIFLPTLLITILLSYLLATLTYRFWKYELTEDAIKIEKGIVWKKYISIPFERVQNIDIYRGVIARILKLSDLHIQTAGYSAIKQYGRGSEGRLPGLNIQVAEQLREDLVKRIKGTKQGL